MATIYAKNKNTGEWERVGPAAAATDATLTLSGSPADAKVTGEAIKAVQDTISALTAEDVGALPADTEIPSVEGLASEAYVDEKLTEVIGGAPELLNTLDELSAALNDDENFATTVANQIAEKQDKLTFDETPTEGSVNPVTSGGIKSYIDAVYIPFTINSGNCILGDNYTYANITSMLENNKTVLLYTAADSEGITKFIFKFNIKNLDTDKNMYYLQFDLIQNDGASNIIVYSVFIYEDNTGTFHSPRLVTNGRKINGKSLSADIVLTAEDVGALPNNTDLGALALKDTVEKTDLASDVQTSLGKADTALQSYTETDPTVPAWAKAASKPSYTADEVGALPNTTVIPDALSDLTDDSTHRTVTDAEKATWNAKSTFSGSYNDLTNKPTIPAAITVDSALSSSSTNPVQNKVVNTALSDKAPTSHASTATTYGKATSSNYGHVKLSDSTSSTSSTSGGTAATPAAVKAAYDLAKGKANASHNQAASTITAGTFAGAVVAKDDTNYTTYQVRNAAILSAKPSSMTNGRVAYVYS